VSAAQPQRVRRGCLLRPTLRVQRRIQAEISKLIAQMNQSIAKADEFVKNMP